MSHKDYDLYNGLLKEVELGNVTQSVDGDYILFKYTADCHKDKAWNKFNRHARGIIFNTKTKELVCRPFSKFFSVDEMEENKLELLPIDKPCSITNKLDGSCVSTFIQDGKLSTATPGAFQSDQAVWGLNWLNGKFLSWPQDERDMLRDAFLKANESNTFVFEVIYPDNHVVQYDFQGMVLLAIFGHDGKEHHPTVVDIYAKKYGFRRPEKFDLNLKLAREIKLQKYDNAEGYVIHWPEFNLRVKLKFDDYMQLHKLKDSISEKGITELLADGSYGNFIKILPKHLALVADDISASLRSRFFTHKHKVEDCLPALLKLPTRKEQALTIQKILPRSLWHIAFSYLDHAYSDRLIWRLIHAELKTPKEVTPNVL